MLEEGAKRCKAKRKPCYLRSGKQNPDRWNIAILDWRQVNVPCMDLKNRDILCLWIFLSTVQLCFQKSTVHSPTYVGAVVEYSPRIPDETNQHSLLTLNVEKYSHFIMEAAAKDVDIIVFPEYELSSYGLPWRKMFNNPDFLTHIPDPQEQINPCVNESVNVSQAFRNISCSARHHKIYVVVVAIERTPCDNEATCSLSQKFATSVAFNREGTVIGKYRDSNLFGEPLFTKPYPQEISTFDTDFGVKFGMISGMDIVSHIPTRELINRKVLDFVYPHFWRNELPFYTGIQVQAAWSRAQNVNLLAAAHNNPGIGCGGSGIHSGRKGTRTVYVGSNSSKLLFASLDKIHHPQKDKKRQECAVDVPDSEVSLQSYPSYKNFQIQKDHLIAYSTIDLSKYFDYRGIVGTVDRNFSLCHTSLCCSFEVKMNTIFDKHGSKYNMDPYGYYYRLVAFNGLKSLNSVTTIGVQVCAVIACRGENITSCGQITNSTLPVTITTTFEKLKISGNFKKGNSEQIPTSLTEKLGILPETYYTFKSYESTLKNYVKFEMYSIIPNISLYTFGIYGRDFEKDGTPISIEDLLSGNN